MTQILGPTRRWEFPSLREDSRELWYQRYIAVVGGFPPEEEDPSLEQLSALHRRLTTQDTAPFVDMAIFVPFGQRALKASKFRTYVLTLTGYVTKENSRTCHQWRTCFRLLRTALIMMDSVGVAERLSRIYPSAWHLIYAADEVARSSHSNRIGTRAMMSIKAGRSPPEGLFDQNRPWDFVYHA